LLGAIIDEYGELCESVILWNSVLLKLNPKLFYDQETQMQIDRYCYCRDNPGTPAYPGSYGQLPAQWVDMSRIIGAEIIKCAKERQRRG